MRGSERALTATASIVTIAVPIAAGGALGKLWPVGVVVAEGAAIMVLGAWLYRERRAVRHHPADQELLTEILALLSRPAMEALRFHDFAAAWPASIVYPFEAFIRDFGGIEHRFRDEQLEKAREHLYVCADEFTAAESYGHNADRPARPDGVRMRFVGITSGSTEGVPELARLHEEAYRRILEPAWALADAHDRFLAVAIERDYDVKAVAGGGGTHPTVQHLLDLDEKYG